MTFVRHALVGLTAGAVGTAALNVATYADIAARGRPESSTPSTLVKNVASSAGIEPLASDDETAQHRRSGVGALLGYVNGLGVGVVYGLIRPQVRDHVPMLVGAVAAGAAAMLLSDVPATKAGATDPKQWDAASWAADAVPHLLFGLALAVSFDALDA